MKKYRLVLFVVLGLLTALTPAFGRHRGHAKTTPTPIHETVISSVTPTQITVTEDKETKTFTITQFTEVTVDGKKASAADLKPGMMVTVTLTDQSRLSRITAVNKK